MPGSTATTFDAFLKDNYITEEVARLVNTKHVFLDRLDTTQKGTGRKLIVPIMDANPQGLAADLANAQTAAQQTTGGNIGGAQFAVNWGDYSANVVIGDKIMAQSASETGAFLQDRKEEIDGLYRAWGDTFAEYLLRDAGHALSNGTGTIATGVVTLTNPSDIVNFERGQILNASANDGTHTTDTLLGSGSAGYVIKVNYNAGTFTVATTSGGAAGNPSGWTGSMYFFRQGDFGGTASPTRVVLGFGAWCPSSDPTAGESFEGVDRSFDVVRRSGIRLTSAQVSGMPTEQRIKKLVTYMMSRGHAPTDIFIHPEKWWTLAEGLESRGNRPLDGKAGIFWFPKLQLASPAGTVDVWADRFMPIDTCYALDFDGVRFKSLDGFPKIVNGDGMQMLRLSSANAYELRLTSYPAYYHRAPNHVGRCPLA